MTQEEEININHYINKITVERLGKNKLLSHVLDIDLSDLSIFKLSDYKLDYNNELVYIKDFLFKTIDDYYLVSDGIDTCILEYIVNKLYNNNLTQVDCIKMLEDVADKYMLNIPIHKDSVDLLFSYCNDVKDMYNNIIKKLDLHTNKFNHLLYRTNICFKDDTCMLSQTIVITSERVKL